MVIFFLIVSFANLALGYFVAVKFHAALFPPPADERELVRVAGEFSSLPLPTASEAVPVAIPAREPTLHPLASVEANPLLAPTSDERGVVASPLASIPAAALPINMPAAAMPDLPAAPVAKVPRTKPVSLAAVSVDDFMRGLSDFRAQLSALDQQVRKCAKSPDTREIERCVQEFRAANHSYLERSTETTERLVQGDPAESIQANHAREAVQVAIAKQAEEVRRTEDRLSQMNIAEDPKGSCETLLSSTQALSTSNDTLRDGLQIAKRELLPQSDEEEVSEGPYSYDELTQIPSREMFDGDLRRQIQRKEDFCLALIDVDQCCELNNEHGQAVTDEILKSLAKIIAASARGDCRAARYSGQQFSVLYPGQLPDSASLAVETIRQIVHLTEFKHVNERLEVSVSVTMIAGNGTDSLSSIEKRMNEGVSAAKKLGRNRSFLFEAGEIKPIAPPALDLQASTYKV